MTSEFVIRQFRPADADGVAALWNDVLPSEQPWNHPRYVICRKHNRNDGLFFIGEQDGLIIATALAGYDGIRGWIYALAVAAEHRRKGYGRQLVEEAERELLARGCAKINLQVRERNAEVNGFYERCGFTAEPISSFGKPLPSAWAPPADQVPTIAINGKVSLTAITWDDKPSFIKHLNESDIFSTVAASMRFPYEDIDADLWLSKATRNTWDSEGLYNWAIRKDDGELIGGIGLFNMKPREKAEIGYWLAQPFWGQGIMTAAVRRLCEFGFTEHNLKRIYAHVAASNSASARVLEKAGFEQEGRLRNHDIRDGVASDLLVLGLLSPE